MNPGSDEAIKKGCTCPVLDNAHGKGSGWTGKDGKPLFWTNENCPMHGVKVAEKVSKKFDRKRKM